MCKIIFFSLKKENWKKNKSFFPRKKSKMKKSANFFVQSSLWKLWKKSSYEVEFASFTLTMQMEQYIQVKQVICKHAYVYSRAEGAWQQLRNWFLIIVIIIIKLVSHNTRHNVLLHLYHTFNIWHKNTFHM